MFRLAGSLLAAALIPIGGLLFCVIFSIQEFMLEARYRRQFGSAWQAAYESDYGSLSRAHARVTAAMVGVVVILALMVWLYLILSEKQWAKSGGKRRHRHRHESNVERVVRFRRNAMLGIYFGLLGIATGLALALVRWGIFSDHQDESILGIFVFLAGYCCVINGCWWWVKAKNWSEGVVAIGLAPILVFLVPYVRLIFIFNPLLLGAAMVMMPIILLVVVSVLPDKSGINRKPMSWEREENSGQREDG